MVEYKIVVIILRPFSTSDEYLCCALSISLYGLIFTMVLLVILVFIGICKNIINLI